jgi:hypothetical protein
MRGILAIVLTLSVLAGVAGSAYAADFPRDFWQEQQTHLP